MIATVLNISEDIWGEVPSTIVDISELQVSDFAKWVRKQVRLFGRKTDICNQQYSAIEVWLQELGIATSFIAGGEVLVNGEWAFSGFQASGYYMFDENGAMETKASKWLEIVSLEDQQEYLIAR